MHDLVICNGTVIDGTGTVGVRADVAVEKGRIVSVGVVGNTAKRTIDATGCVVAPGFIDIHTHYDAQIFWDPFVTPSCLHGVTTIVGGNCGFSIAPLSPEAGGYLMRMLARVEGIPLESLERGVPWNWRSFGEYLDLHEGRLALNAGFLVGHSALRRVVMNERANAEKATDADLAAMRALLRESLRAGGLGFSSSVAVTHSDLDGNPVPSRFASREEIIALAGEVRDFPGTTLEFIPGVGMFSDSQMDLMVEMSLAAQRPINWNLLSPSSSTVDLMRNQLSASNRASARGARVIALTIPQVLRFRLNLRSGFVFDVIPGWAGVLALPLEERRRAFGDPSVRTQLRAGSESDGLDPFFRSMFDWNRMRVAETFEPGNKAYEGRTLGDIAKEVGKHPLDALLDIALLDDLRTSFVPFVDVAGDDAESWRLRAAAWHDTRTIVGGSDAGAHVDTTDSFAFPSEFIAKGVREHGLISMEEAVRQLTDVPASVYGIVDRGRLALGYHADIVVFDPTAMAVGPVHTRYDFPGGAGRLYAESKGVRHVFVNGVEVVRGATPTGETPGTVLRSGRATRTVLPA